MYFENYETNLTLKTDYGRPKMIEHLPISVSGQLKIAESIHELQKKHLYFLYDDIILNGEEGCFSIESDAVDNSVRIILDDQLIKPHHLLMNRLYCVENNKINYHKTLQFWNALNQYAENIDGPLYEYPVISQKMRHFIGENKIEFTKAIIHLIENSNCTLSEKRNLVDAALALKNPKIDHTKLTILLNHLSQKEDHEEKFERQNDQFYLDESLRFVIDSIIDGVKPYLELTPFYMTFFYDNNLRKEKQDCCQLFIEILAYQKDSLTRETFLERRDDFLIDMCNLSLDYKIDFNDSKGGESYKLIQSTLDRVLGIQNGSARLHTLAAIESKKRKPDISYYDENGYRKIETEEAILPQWISYPF